MIVCTSLEMSDISDGSPILLLHCLFYPVLIARIARVSALLKFICFYGDRLFVLK